MSRTARRKRDTKTGVVDQLETLERADRTGRLELPTGLLEVSNLKKVFYPKSGHTKGDLMRYYARIAPYLLPAIADRPLVLKRFPNGVDGEAFYQQKAPSPAPRSVRVERVADEGFT